MSVASLCRLSDSWGMVPLNLRLFIKTAFSEPSWDMRSGSVPEMLCSSKQSKLRRDARPHKLFEQSNVWRLSSRPLNRCSLKVPETRLPNCGNHTVNMGTVIVSHQLQYLKTMLSLTGFKPTRYNISSDVAFLQSLLFIILWLVCRNTKQYHDSTCNNACSSWAAFKINWRSQSV